MKYFFVITLLIRVSEDHKLSLRIYQDLTGKDGDFQNIASLYGVFYLI